MEKLRTDFHFTSLSEFSSDMCLASNNVRSFTYRGIATSNQAHYKQIIQLILHRTLAISGGSACGCGCALQCHDSFQGRIQLATEEKVREGDWSVVLQSTMLSDSDMYECILEGRKTLSTVWLTVTGEWEAEEGDVR